jgi:hypothetical protein
MWYFVRYALRLENGVSRHTLYHIASLSFTHGQARAYVKHYV